MASDSTLPRHHSIAAVVSVAPSLLGACIVVALWAGLQVGIGIGGATVIGTGLFIAVSGWCLWPMRKMRPRLGGQDLVAAALCALVTIALWDRAATRSMFWPHAFGVDQAHHGALTTFIFDTNGPPAIVGRLGGMANYPAGAHELAASVATILGLSPLSATWFTALSATFIQLWAIAWVATLASRHHGVLTSAITISIWIAGWGLGVGTVSESFYFSQTVAVLFGIVGVGLLIVGRRSSTRWYLPAALLGVAAVLTYPQAAVVIPGAALLIAWGPLRQYLRTLPGRVRHAGALMVLVIAVLGFEFARSSAGLRSSLQGVGEGSVRQMNITNLGGPVAVLLMMVGLYYLVRGAFRSREDLLPLIGAISAPIVVAIVFMAIRRGGFPIVSYRIQKNGFAAFPFLCVAGGFGATSVVTSVIARTDRQRGSAQLRALGPVMLSALTSLALLVYLSGPVKLRSTAVPLVDRDAYELARLATRGLIPDDIALAGDGLSPYTIWWAGIGRTASYQSKPLIPRMTLFETWPIGRPENYLLVDSTVRERYENRPGVIVVASRNGAALLKRTP